MLIDPSKIDNSWSTHEVLTLVVPALTRLADRVSALEAHNKSFQAAPAKVYLEAPRPAPALFEYQNVTAEIEAAEPAPPKPARKPRR